MEQIRVTEHAKDRIKERHGLGEEAAERLAGKALEKGISHSETTGKLREYCNFLWNKNRTANNIRVYGDFIYIFSGVTLITMWALPQEYKKVVVKLRKKLEGENMDQMQVAMNKAITPQQSTQPQPMVIRPQPLIPKPADAVVVDIPKLMKALADNTKLSRADLAKKFDIAINTLNALFDGDSKSLGPAFKVLIELHPAFTEAYQKIMHHYEEVVLKNARKIQMLEEAANLRQKLANLEREIKGM